MRKFLSLLVLTALFGACTPRTGAVLTIPQQGVAQVTPGKYTVTITGIMTVIPSDSSVVVVPPADTVVVIPPKDTIPVVNPPIVVGDASYYVGLTTHPWIRPTLTGPIKFHRWYFSSYYAWVGREGKIKPYPMLQGETAVARGLDDMLANEKAAGNQGLLSIHQTPTWLVNQGRMDGGGDFPPCLLTANRADTSSYLEYAKFLFEITKRLGDKTWPLTSLNVDTTARWTGDGSVPKSGMGLLKWIQVWNEPDKWWTAPSPGIGAYMTPEETAALMSMTFDWIKRGDPSMQVVMPCLTDLNFGYVMKMDAWFKKHRKDKKWPCDIAAFNHYSNSGNVLNEYPAKWNMAGGVVPALDKSFPQIKPIVAFFKAMGIPVWITETGFDSGGGSPMQYPGGEEARGQAIVETLKAYRAEGVVKVIIFTTADERNAAAGGLYVSSGLFTGELEGYRPKGAFKVVTDYINSLNVKALPYQSTEGYYDRTKPVTLPKPYYGN